MGGGGMYMRQGRKRKNEDEDDLFVRSEDDSDEIAYGEPKEEEIPQDNIVNKFVNWFRIKKG